MPPGSPERAAAKANLTTKYGNKPVTIAMIGVWDTVGSLGIPSLFGGVDPLLYGFLDTQLSVSVKAAYHAISIDERRKAFPPTLWVSQNVPGQILEQVWFSGCHSSVGGGCKDCGLSDITLKWMMGKCIDNGLIIDPVVWKKYQDLDAAAHGLDEIDESWTVLWGLPYIREVSPDANVASTVACRLQHLLSYLPVNLKITPQRALEPTYKTVAI